MKPRAPSQAATPDSAATAPAARSRTGDPPAAIPSAQILQGRDAVNIEHHGRIYQLRQTKQGKLILTK
jgi:hemin uptake protein HemP